MASVGESRMDAEAIHLEIAKGQCEKSSQCPLGGFPVELVIKIARAVEFATDDENESEGFSTPPASPAFDRPCPGAPARKSRKMHLQDTASVRSPAHTPWSSGSLPSAFTNRMLDSSRGSITAFWAAVKTRAPPSDRLEISKPPSALPLRPFMAICPEDRTLDVPA